MPLKTFTRLKTSISLISKRSFNAVSKVQQKHSSVSDEEARRRKLMAKSLPKRKKIPGVKNIVLVASGKGGVGKSTTAINLALALSRLDGKNHDVGILDADVYGPSIPIMLNLTDSDPPNVTDTNLMVPLSNYGLKAMSMGFLVQQQQAVVWRGPMVMGATEKMAFQTHWGELDYLIVDSPPGTGDIHLTIAQTMDVSGVIIVSTPQKVALADAFKGLSMFNSVNIPVLGLVENMNAFVCPNCGTTSKIFGSEGLQKLSQKAGVDVLGSIPLDPIVMQSSDDGKPVTLTNPESQAAQEYKRIATRIDNALSNK